METYTIATLKKANRQNSFLCPSTPHIYFCAVIEMDYDGPDLMGPPISDFVKVDYEGKPALALVYDYDSSGEDMTVRDAVNTARHLGLSDDAPLLMMDQKTGKVYPIIKAHSCIDMLLLSPARQNTSSQ